MWTCGKGNLEEVVREGTPKRRHAQEGPPPQTGGGTSVIRDLLEEGSLPGRRPG